MLGCVFSQQNKLCEEMMLSSKVINNRPVPILEFSVC